MKKKIKVYIVKHKDKSWNNLYREQIFSEKKNATHIAEINGEKVYRCELTLNPIIK